MKHIKRGAFSPNPLAKGVLLACIVLTGIIVQRYRQERPGPSAASSKPIASKPVDKAGAEAENAGASTTDRSSSVDAPHSAPRKLAQLGQLREVGADVYLSTAGLRYSPGSREGHRLKHVLLHTKDQPGRPGSHGVFLGGRDGALATVDAAYLIAKQGGDHTQVEQQGVRTVYTVDLGKAIGYVGGQIGKRREHPRVTHVRIVLEGTNVITAFPVSP